MQVFSMSALNPHLAQLGPNGAEAGANWSCWAEGGPEVIQIGLKLKPCDAHGSRSHAQSGATWDPLAAASHQFGPNGDITWGTLLQTKRHR